MDGPLRAVDFLVLVVLLRGDNYGYGLVQAIRETSGGEVDLLPGNLYAVLQRLERNRLIRAQGHRRPGTGGPPRAYYAITSAGRLAAAAEARRLDRLLGLAEVRALAQERWS